MTPRAFTLADLRDALAACADLPPGLALDDPEITLFDLGLDSACWLSLQLELRDRYHVQLDQSDVETGRSLGDMVTLVDSRLHEARA